MRWLIAGNKGGVKQGERGETRRSDSIRVLAKKNPLKQ